MPDGYRNPSEYGMAYENVYIKTKDGLTLHAWLVKANQNPKLCRTIIFFHGNPTSSFLYRNIIKNLKNQYRCIAADMLGMGDSDKLENSGHMSYTFELHYKYLSEFIRSLELTQPEIGRAHV